MQTILIEDHDDLYNIFSLNLNTYAGTDVIRRPNAADAIALLQILPTIDLIITRNQLGSENSAEDLYNHIKSSGSNTPMIVIGENANLSGKVLCLKEPVNWETLVQNATQLLGVTSEDLKNKIKPDYMSVDTFYFYDITTVPCDIFIRIKKSVSEFQFVKRIHSKDTFTIETIQKYESQGLKEFYVASDYQQYFVTFVTNQLIQKLESNDLDMNERITTTANSYTIVQEQLDKIGMGETVVQLSDSAITSMQKSVSDNKDLSPLLSLLFTSKISYAYQHAHLITVIGNFIVSKQSWYEPKYLNIISFVAFFSDITLKTSKQIMINSQAELDESDLTDAEKTAVTYHAKNAAELLKDHPSGNEYLELVTLQHQGTKNGVGFAENPDEDLHPISKVFIIADAFVKILLNPKKPSVKKEIIEMLQQQFSGSTYQKIIKVLEQRID